MDRDVSRQTSAPLHNKWPGYLDETRTQERVLLEVFLQIGLDPSLITPARKVVGHIGESRLQARHTESLRDGMHAFVLPIAMPTLTISILWHPRHDADLAHQWLRSRLLDICAR